MRGNNAKKKKVLFICTHNSARSQMAEGLLKAMFGQRCEVYSAGVQPSSVDPFAIKAMKEIDIDISNQYSKHIDELKGKQFDYVITVCDQAREACPHYPLAERTIHMDFEDPTASMGSDAERLTVFRRIRDEIKDWIESFFGAEKNYENKQ